MTLKSESLDKMSAYAAYQLGGVHILYNADGVGGWVEVLLYFVIYGGFFLTFVI